MSPTGPEKYKKVKNCIEASENLDTHNDASAQLDSSTPGCGGENGNKNGIPSFGCFQNNKSNNFKIKEFPILQVLEKTCNVVMGV